MSKKHNLRRIQAVDLFCGIGGLTHGFSLSGIDVKADFDIDPSCQYAYEANNCESNFFTTDVRHIHFRDIAPHYKDANVTVMTGCVPCQPFLAHSRKPQTLQTDDCLLVKEFALHRMTLPTKDEPIVIFRMACHIGNAVPVNLAKAIGKSVMEAVNPDNRHEMNISLNVLNHLGLSLYSNIPAVFAEVIAKLQEFRQG